MSSDLACKVGHLQRRILAEAPGHRTNPARRFPRRFAARSLHEPLQGCTQALLVRFPAAEQRQGSSLRAGASTQPSRDGSTGKQPASKPGRIELDLDLLEPRRRNGVTMSSPGPIENGRGASDEGLSEFALVQIPAYYEHRQQRPIMGALPNPRTASIDNP